MFHEISTIQRYKSGYPHDYGNPRRGMKLTLSWGISTNIAIYICVYIYVYMYIYIYYIYIIIYSYGPIYRWFTSDWPIQIVGYWNPMGFPTLRHRKSPSPSHRWIDLWCFIFTLGAAASGLELRLNSLVWGARAGRLLGTVLRGKKMGGTKN